MNKLEVGMYLRTKQKPFQSPQIVKIVELKQDRGYHNQYYITLDKNLIPNYNFKIYEEDVEKASYNIIDLIEVGDYVNGYKIIELATNIDGKVIYLETNITEFDNMFACGNINIYEKEIKSIVTHEQMEQMEYEVK